MGNAEYMGQYLRTHTLHYTGPIPTQEYSLIEMKLLKLLLPLLVVASCSGFSLDSILGGAVQETEAEKPIDEIEEEEEAEEEEEDEAEALEDEEEVDEVEEEEEEDLEAAALEEEAEEEDEEEEEEDEEEEEEEE